MAIPAASGLAPLPGPHPLFLCRPSQVARTAGSRVLAEPAQPALNPLWISQGTILDTRRAFGAGGSPTALGRSPSSAS